MEWIKCSDRLPPKTMRVLVTIDAGEDYRPFVESEARWNAEKQCFEKPCHTGAYADFDQPDCWWGKITAKVTHWMPMPSPAED